ncbi:hypothetical protein NQD34_007505 [Periophthalmus magnuspinnatus]|nr:hypothetical protein NQD34_007505 [Periophthalmus magnuspinnatus]
MTEDNIGQERTTEDERGRRRMRKTEDKRGQRRTREDDEDDGGRWRITEDDEDDRRQRRTPEDAGGQQRMAEEDGGRRKTMSFVSPQNDENCDPENLEFEVNKTKSLEKSSQATALDSSKESDVL